MPSATTQYLAAEGRENIDRCMDLAFAWCADHEVDTVVIFSGTGEGPRYAARNLLPRERYRDMRVVVVTPAVGRSYRQTPGDPNSPLIRAGLAPEVRDELRALNVAVVSAHLPFKPYAVGFERATEWNRVAEAYGVLGGGFALCVQAAMLAADAGEIPHGARIVSSSADTAVEITYACRTESFLAATDGLLVGHIICRPAKYTISKREHEAIRPAAPVIAPGPPTPVLPPAPSSPASSPAPASALPAPPRTGAPPPTDGEGTSVAKQKRGKKGAPKG